MTGNMETWQKNARCSASDMTLGRLHKMIPIRPKTNLASEAKKIKEDGEGGGGALNFPCLSSSFSDNSSTSSTPPLEAWMLCCVSTVTAGSSSNHSSRFNGTGLKYCAKVIIDLQITPLLLHSQTRSLLTDSLRLHAF